MSEQGTETYRASEQDEVRRRRYREARRADLSHEDACRFADSDRDVGELRRLVRLGCPTSAMARILR